MKEQQTLFRKKALDRISSPEQLTDYLRVTNPGIWVLLAIVLLLLGSLFAWSAIGTLETKADAKVVVKDHVAEVLCPDGAELAEGMPLAVSGEETKLASASQDEYGRYVGVAEVSLPDGMYDGTVVTETVHPIKFLIKSDSNTAEGGSGQ